MITADLPPFSLAWTFRWELREHRRALQAATRHAAHARWLRPLLLIGLVGGLVVAAIGFVAVAPVAAGLGSGIAIMVLWVLLFRWIGPWLGAWHTRRNDPAVHSEVRHAADDGGFSVHCAGQHLRLEWSGITRVVETSEFFLVYFQRAAAYYAPKRVIEPGEIKALRALVRRELGTRAEVAGC